MHAELSPLALHKGFDAAQIASEKVPDVIYEHDKIGIGVRPPPPPPAAIHPYNASH